MIIKNFKILSKYLLNRLYKLIIKKSLKGKQVMPNNFPVYIYEIFNNINEVKQYDKKIIMPYIDIDNYNIMNIYRPYEIMEATNIPPKSSLRINLNNKHNDIVLPIALLDKKGLNENLNETIEIMVGTKKTKIQIKYKNRFHYLPIKSKSSVNELSVSSDISCLSVAKPIYRETPRFHGKPKLIVQIFVDAFAQSMIEKFGYDIIPNTKKFFEKGGAFYTNAYAQSEWTLSSIAGIFTGKYTNEHLIYHPRKEDKIEHTTIADVLQGEGYITFGCSNVPKLTPLNGFDKGFDRFIQSIDKDYNYIINEACEQLDAFGGNQYLFLGFFDTHEAHRLQPVSSQVLNDLKDFNFKKLKGNSKDTSIIYDNERINMFKNSIKHFDNKLKRLYEKITNYDNEAMVVLHSDHGVNFMTETNELLGKEREKVIFLYKNNKEHISDNSIKEIRELPSMMCNDLGIANRFNYKKNSYSITESLFPGKEYELSIRSNKHVLFFKVDWEDIANRNFLDYHSRVSFHKIDNEIKKINVNRSNEKDYLRLLDVAKDHYKSMCKNLIKKEN